MHFRLIHPAAGVVAEFASAHAMIEYFMQKGRQSLPEGAEAKGLLLQISQGGLFFQEFIDGPGDPMQLSLDGALFMNASRLLQ